MVRVGQVRELDKLGNDAADEAADSCRRRVNLAILDARRNLSCVCRRWSPIILDLHRFFIAISCAVVNHDDRKGTAPDTLVWSAGSLPKRRRLVDAVRNHAMLPVDQRLFGPWVVFLSSLHWRASGADLGVGGVSYVELLYCMSFEQERGWLLCLDIAGQVAQFQCRLFLLVQALVFGDHEGSLGLSRALADCSLRDRCQSLQVATCWLTSRPEDTAGLAFLDELLVLFRYAPRSAPALYSATAVLCCQVCK